MFLILLTHGTNMKIGALVCCRNGIVRCIKVRFLGLRGRSAADVCVCVCVCV